MRRAVSKSFIVAWCSAAFGLLIVWCVGTPSAQAEPSASPFYIQWQDVPAAPASGETKWTVSMPAMSKLAEPKSPDYPVSLPQALYLTRSALLTLNDANHSGNYTVLRDLSAPAFHARNTPDDLSRRFADLRARKSDLYAAALVAPQLSTPPRYGPNGLLRLTGYFPTRPMQIDFDLLFQEVDGHWRLFDISVRTLKTPSRREAQTNSPNPG